MKHEQSNVRPPRYIVELFDDISARVTVTDESSVEETQDADGNTVFSYNQFVTNKPYRANLSVDVAEHFDAWFQIVKDEDQRRTAAANRARRNALLRESDCELTLDRMGLETPTGSTFSAWLSFLKKLGETIGGEWAVYRQALRDLPTLPNWPYLNDDDWPKPPRA